MDQVVDRPETETCAKWTLAQRTLAQRTLGGVLRTGALLAGAAFASVLMVDLPVPAPGGAADGQGAIQPYVPTSDKWIELGVPQSPATQPGLWVRV